MDFRTQTGLSEKQSLLFDSQLILENDLFSQSAQKSNAPSVCESLSNDDNECHRAFNVQ